MQHITCGICGNDKSPTNASLVVDNVVHCDQCLKEKFPLENDLKGKAVVRKFDPTVCMNCERDGGEMSFRLHGSFPMCDDCLRAVQAKIFPTWVKAFFAGVLFLVVFSLAWNWRFIDAYYKNKKSDYVAENGTLEEVADHYASLADNLPEVREVQDISNYYKGLLLLKEDKAAEALELFHTCETLTEDYNLKVYTLQAEISTLFESRDYTGFTQASRQYLAYDTSAIALAQVASAYACQYAEQKSDSTKVKAEEYLQRARSANDTTSFFADYINRIEYRLATGEIIDKKAFDERYPNGWTK